MAAIHPESVSLHHPLADPLHPSPGLVERK